MRASNLLAAGFLLNGKDKEAVRMLFYNALLMECLSRGYIVVSDLIKGMWSYPDGYVRIRGQTETTINSNSDLFFSEFDHICRAVVYTRYRFVNACSHLCDRLKPYDDIETRHVHQQLEKEKENPLKVGPLHTMNTSNADTKPFMMITINWSDPVDLWVYGDTKLKWIFQYCFGSGRKKKLMKGIAVPREPCLCLVDGGKDDIHWAERKRFYLASSGNQTLDELGIGHKSTYGIYQCMSIQVRRDFNPNDFRVSERGGLPTLTQTTPAKTETKSEVKKHKKSKRKKRIKRLQTEDNKEEPTDGELRQLSNGTRLQ